MVVYSYEKTTVDNDLLVVEINNSEEISQDTIGVTHIAPNVLKVSFANELNQDEQFVLATIVSNHDASQGEFYEENVYVKKKIKGRLYSETWYNSKDENNNPVGKARDIVYTYIKKKKYSAVEKIYFKGGTVFKTYNWSFYEDSSAGEEMGVRVEA